MTRAELLAGVAAVGAGTRAGSPSQVTGSFYRYAPGEADPPPIAGAAVYIRPDGATAWLGPSVSDTTGHFSFSNVPPGSYVLRAFLGRRFLWEQTFVASDRPIPPVVCAVHDPGTTVICYNERSDGAQVTRLIKSLGYTNVLTRPGTQIATNIVRFGSSVALEDVKLFGSAFVAALIPLRAIRRFTSDSPQNLDVIETGTDPKLNDPLLSIRAITSAPNFARGSPGELPLSLSPQELLQIAGNRKTIPSPPAAS
jgi:hypothetical protein